MDKNDLKQIYIKYKNILSGCRTIFDSLYFAQDIINKFPESKYLINGMIHGKSYEKILDFRTVAHTLNILNDYNSRNDINEYINNNLKNSYDIIQIGAFMRIGKNKKLFQEVENTTKIYKLNNEFSNYTHSINNNDNDHDNDNDNDNDN